jgi:hypothetical protein
MFVAKAFLKLGSNASKAGDSGTAYSNGIVATAIVFLFTETVRASWLTVPWLYPTKVFPLILHATGNAWGVVEWLIGNG